MPRPRRLRLPLPAGRPRKLTPAEIQQIKARPWPRLPVWLWVAAAVTTVAMLALGAALVLQPGPSEVTVPLGARRTPGTAGLTHDVGPWRAPALEPPTSARAVVATADCPRLAGLRLVGTEEDVRLLRAAAGEVCALRSEGGIDEARAALNEAGAVVAFAGFTATGNESTLLADPATVARALDLRGARVAVLVNGKFAGGSPKRVAAVLVHEGAHLAAGATGAGAANGGSPGGGSPGGTASGGTTPDGAAMPDAAEELVARRAELAACGRLFPASAGLRPNRGCQDAGALVDLGEPGALAELRAAGYR